MPTSNMWTTQWPVWLSPRQALVVPVSNSESLNEYAMDVGNVLKAGRLYAVCTLIMGGQTVSIYVYARWLMC